MIFNKISVFFHFTVSCLLLAQPTTCAIYTGHFVIAAKNKLELGKNQSFVMKTIFMKFTVEKFTSKKLTVVKNVSCFAKIKFDPAASTIQKFHFIIPGIN